MKEEKGDGIGMTPGGYKYEKKKREISRSARKFEGERKQQLRDCDTFQTRARASVTQRGNHFGSKTEAKSYKYRLGLL